MTNYEELIGLTLEEVETYLIKNNLPACFSPLVMNGNIVAMFLREPATGKMFYLEFGGKAMNHFDLPVTAVESVL